MMMPPKSTNTLSSSTIQRVLADKELARTLNVKVKEAGVHTSFGYHAVLRQFLASEAVVSKVKQWEKEDAEEDDTASNSSASKLGDLATLFTTTLALNEETVDPAMTSPLTTKSVISSCDTPSPRSANTTFSPSCTLSSLPCSFRSDRFVESPTFRKQFVDFLGSHPKNPFNLNLKDEMIVTKKHTPKCQRNLQSRRRSSNTHADESARLQSLDDDSRPDEALKHEFADDKYLSSDDF